MTAPADRILTRIPDAELARRWSLVRQAMTARGLDALVIQNTNDWLGGYVRYFTDIPANNGYPRTVVFPVAGPMTVVEMGAFGGHREFDGNDGVHRGVGRHVTTPSFLSIDFTHHYDADLAADALTGARRIGWVTPGAMPHAFVLRVRERLGAGTEHLDATAWLDAIKAVKSPAEIALMRAAAGLQDEVFASLLDYIRPGLRDVDVTAFAQQAAQVRGSEQGIFLGASAPVGVRSLFLSRSMQGRTLAAGDHLSLLIEVNGPGGLYTELARTMVLGRASPALREGFDQVSAAQDHLVSLLKPGADPAAIHAAHNAFMAGRGLPIETRLCGHGQGYDMVERPLLRHDETMPLAAGMCLAVHPSYETDELFAVTCDNYLIGPDGACERLHQTDRRIMEIT